MDSEAVADLILRAVAAMRERGDLPDVENPLLTITQLRSEGLPLYRSNAGAALFAAQQNVRPTAAEFAEAIAAYLREVVDLVPAYSDVRLISPDQDGGIVITLRAL